MLETEFSLIWISGEISNFHKPGSGHCYFTLKDDTAQIRVIMFRMQAAQLTFKLRNGLHVTGFGRISVYEPRGIYQIIFEYLEPMGIGQLYIEFEQLKTRLLDEGIFDEKHKKQLPLLPKKISIITSPSGAVVYDIIRIIKRRFPNIVLEIVPVKVQGDEAIEQIVSGIGLINDRGDADLVIIARGGGSLEDFHAFNSEAVARALFSLAIPVISGVGHETDTTIVDYVADLRAPTPSAAAELSVPERDSISNRLNAFNTLLKSGIGHHLQFYRYRTHNLSARIIDPTKKIQDQNIRLDDAVARMVRTLKNNIELKRNRLLWRKDKLDFENPIIQIQKHKEKLVSLTNNMLIIYSIYIRKIRAGMDELSSCLKVLGPHEILSRGYSITRTWGSKTIITDPKQVASGENLEIMVSKGQFKVNVIDDNKSNN